MISTTKSLARTAAAGLALAAAFTLAGPAVTASAINRVQCDPGKGFLKIKSHLNGRDSVACYANAGKTDFGGWWVDEISTGNNDVKYYDANGDVLKINRGTVKRFPNNPPKVKAIEIL